MKLARVIGNVVATRKTGNTEGMKILVARVLAEDLTPTAATVACIDTVNAGAGDLVLLCSSSSARMTAMTAKVATDNTIVAVVDAVSHGRNDLYTRVR
ncbi:MAG TPA: EutN/CcmL family microcompartment protein [Bacteroidota bacterium]